MDEMKSNVTYITEKKMIGLQWYKMDTWSFDDAIGDTIMEKYESLYVKLMEIFDKLDGSLWIVCGRDVGSIFETATAGFEPELSPEGVDLSKLEFYRSGRMHNKFDLYIDGTLIDIMYINGKNGIIRLRIKDFII